MRRNSDNGQALLLAVVLLAVVMGLVAAFVNYNAAVNRASRSYTARVIARQAAMAGIDKAVWCLNQSTGTNCGGTYGSNYTGETGVQVGDDSFYSTTITTVSGNQKTVTSTGYFPSVSDPVSTVTIKADAITNTTGASFNYGVQVGKGGFELEENAFVAGNIYANGSIVGGSGSYVDGAVWVAGGTELSADQEQETNNEDYIFGQTDPVEDVAQSFKISEDNVINQISLYLKKTGNPSDASVYIVEDGGGFPSESVIGSANLVASQVTSSFSWVDVTFSDPPALLGGQTYWFVIDGRTQNSRYWTTGSLPNNGYGNGIGMYSDDWDDDPWQDAGRDLTFRIWLGGVPTKIDGVHVYEDAHANTILNATVDADAYYQTISNTTVGGTEFPGSEDPGPENLPISDGQVEQWKLQGASGGTISGDHTVSGVESLGPKKITGNLTIENGASLTVTGTIYVEGNITMVQNAAVSLDSGYGGDSGIILADGLIEVENNVTFNGSGHPDSYVMVLSNSTTLDQDLPAIDINNNSANSIFYAPNGVANVSNNASMKEITAFKVYLRQNASVQYESGLANVNFSSGPSGGWSLKAGSVRETN